jgi:nicotinate-nucleotide adenylyltransferase
MTAQLSTQKGRPIAIFGGTFDPIHSGHLVVAHAAMQRLGLDAIYFVPSGNPPHKPKRRPAAFIHRYAMVALACSGHRGYIASLAEAPDQAGAGFCYSLDTVRDFSRAHPGEHLHFIVGVDSFLQVPTWHRYEQLLEACDFVVANRPGSPMDRLARVIPPRQLAGNASANSNVIALRKRSVYLLPTVESSISATDVRERVRRGNAIDGLVPKSVEDYIRKQALYR